MPRKTAPARRMDSVERALALRVVRRSRRVLEARRRLDLAERELEAALRALEQAAEPPAVDQDHSLAGS